LFLSLPALSLQAGPPLGVRPLRYNEDPVSSIQHSYISFIFENIATINPRNAKKPEEMKSMSSPI